MVTFSSLIWNILKDFENIESVHLFLEAAATIDGKDETDKRFVFF